MNIKVLSSTAFAIVLGSTIIGGSFAYADNKEQSNISSLDNNTYLLSGGENSEQPEFWTIEEYKVCMEQQRSIYQELANKSDLSFYEKNSDGNYVCREWTQDDVDSLYSQWKDQLNLMDKGYHFTKPIDLPDRAFLAGAIDPETWNAQSETSLSSTIITFPDGTTVNLGHFDSIEEAENGVKEYLEQHRTKER